jgi:3-oxoacyl-[acyl-carrier-protein] synthase II
MLDLNGNRRRVVITGLGMVTPLGNDVASTWQAMMNGECGVDTITRFDTTNFPSTIAGFVKNFDPTTYMDKRDARRMAPFLHFAVAATQQALADANLDLSAEDPTRIGSEIGSAIGGADVVEEQRLILEQQGAKRVNPASIPALLINMAGCYIAIHYNIRGPVNASVTACATGISGIGEGMRRIVWGDADVMLAGGTEAAITPLTVSAFGRLTALSRRNDTPKKAITPFDLNRDGTVVGEGAGVVVLELLEHAQSRGAKILAEVKGYSLTSDA